MKKGTNMDSNERNAELNRLYRLLYERDKEFESAKGRRTIITILGFAIFYFVVLCAFEKPTGLNILATFVIAIVFAVVHFLINALIFLQLFQKGRAESETLDAIRKRITEVEKQ